MEPKLSVFFRVKRFVNTLTARQVTLLLVVALLVGNLVYVLDLVQRTQEINVRAFGLHSSRNQTIESNGSGQNQVCTDDANCEEGLICLSANGGLKGVCCYPNECLNNGACLPEGMVLVEEFGESVCRDGAWVVQK